MFCVIVQSVRTLYDAHSLLPFSRSPPDARPPQTHQSHTAHVDEKSSAERDLRARAPRRGARNGAAVARGPAGGRGAAHPGPPHARAPHRARGAVVQGRQCRRAQRDQGAEILQRGPDARRAHRQGDVRGGGARRLHRHRLAGRYHQAMERSRRVQAHYPGEPVWCNGGCGAAGRGALRQPLGRRVSSSSACEVVGARR